MRPSEVRRRILKDHETLRGMLASVEGLGREVVEGERAHLGALRVEGEALHEYLLAHMGWEDRYLAPALRAADAWGKERAAALDHDHKEQRELLAYTLAGLRDYSRPAVMLARSMVDLVRMLREDMDDEERTLLDERVLRDDVIAIDLEAG